MQEPGWGGNPEPGGGKSQVLHSTLSRMAKMQTKKSMCQRVQAGILPSHSSFPLVQCIAGFTRQDGLINKPCSIWALSLGCLLHCPAHMQAVTSVQSELLPGETQRTVHEKLTIWFEGRVQNRLFLPLSSDYSNVLHRVLSKIFRHWPSC